MPCWRCLAPGMELRLDLLISDPGQSAEQVLVLQVPLELVFEEGQEQIASASICFPVEHPISPEQVAFDQARIEPLECTWYGLGQILQNDVWEILIPLLDPH